MNSKYFSSTLLLIGFLFTIINYSKASWTFFYNIGGLPLAKVAPEGIGMIIFVILAFLAWRQTKPTFILSKIKGEIVIITILFLLAIAVRLPQLKLYFFQDDYWFWLCRVCGGYTLFRWEPWLSSHPGLVWETTRYFSGFHTIPYQVVILLSNASFVIGLYLLTRYISNRRLVGFFTSLFFLSTTLNFDAFRWISHVIGFGWQGLFICLSLTALTYELRKFRGKKIPLISLFLVMAAVGSGTARTGAALPILAIMDIIFSFEWYQKKNARKWIVQILKRQGIYLLFPLTFAYVRELILSPNPSPIHKLFPFLYPLKIPVYKLFLFVVGIFVIPPEFEEHVRSFLSSDTDSKTRDFIMQYFGSLYGMLGVVYLLILLFLVVIFIVKKKNHIPLILGMLWTLCFVTYFTFFGSDLPVTKLAIWAYIGPHYLAYTSSAGLAIVVGFIGSSIFAGVKDFLNKKLHFYPLLALLIPSVFVVLILLAQVQQLQERYNGFARIARGQKITSAQFFFETYRKIIPSDAKRIIIVFDDVTLLNRPGNPHPDSRFFNAFWPDAIITILEGDEQLQKFLLTKQPERGSYTPENFYYILTDYYNDNMVVDKSQYLRNKIINTQDVSSLTIITKPEWDSIFYKNNKAIQIKNLTPEKPVDAMQTMPHHTVIIDSTQNDFNPADAIMLPEGKPLPMERVAVNPESGWRDYPYQVKRIIERMLLSALNSFPDIKEKYLKSLLKERLMELGYVVERKDKGNIEKATNRYAAAAGDLTNYLQMKKTLFRDEKKVVYLLLLRHIATIKTLLDHYDDTNSAEWKFVKQDIDSLKLYADTLKN